MTREPNENQLKVLILRKQGLTMRKIGDDLGISKQRVEQILKSLEWRGIDVRKGQENDTLP
jgi:DNA-binding MarR family transcriptional regulator